MPLNHINPMLAALTVDLASLVPDPNNVRKHSEKNIAAIAASLDKFGQITPVVVRASDRVVLKGNGTVAAAVKLGWTKLAATLVEWTSAEESARYAIADNRTAELAEWNYQALQGQMENMLAETKELPIGFDQREFEALTKLFVAPPPAEAKHGDEPTEHYPSQEEYDAHGRRQIVLVYGPDDFEHLETMLGRLREIRQAPDNAALVEALVSEALDRLAK